jgi:hypothetical protein
MWIVINREPRPDAQHWTGRQWLAAADAIAWPIAWVAFVLSTPVSAGVVGQVVVALAAWAGLNRLYLAIWVNHRYWFTTWRWGRVLLAIILMGWVMKLAAPG